MLTLVLARRLSVQVDSINFAEAVLQVTALPLFDSTDSCRVLNGGCDNNAVCSHKAPSNEVICNCKVGYTNTGSSANVTCTGKKCKRPERLTL